MKKKFLTLIVFSFSFTGLVTAQLYSPYAGSDTLTSPLLPEIVISANRFNSIAISTPEAVRVLDVKTVEALQLRTAPEALNLTPGVFVQKTNHGGGSPFLRGLTGNQTLLMIDGIRLSNSTMRYGPNQYFNTIDFFSIGKIEVLRGNGSVQYGSDALGGTIHAFSREISTSEATEWGTSVLSRFATHKMEQSFHADIDFSSRHSAFRTGITWRNFGDLVGGDTTGRQEPSGYREFDYDFKGLVRLSPVSSLTMMLQRVQQSNVPVYHKVVLEDYMVNSTDPQKRRLAYLKFDQKIDAGIFESVIVTASWHHTDEGRQSRKNGSDILRSENDRVSSLGFSTETILSDGGLWSGNTGLEIYNDRISSSRTDNDLTTLVSTPKRGLYPDGSTMTSIAAYSINTFTLEKWNFTAGARYNTFIIKAEDESLGVTTLTPSALVGNIAAMRKLASSSNLFVSVNTGFRAPNIDDLGTLGIVDFRYETPNFNLKPESSFQYQLGYKFQDKMLRGEIFIYRNELYNLITRKRIEDQMIDGYPLYQKENSERAFIQGFETSWELLFDRSWSISGAITCTYGRNMTKNEPLRRIPPLFGRLAADYRKNKWHANIEWLAAGKQSRLAAGDIDDNRIPEGGTPGWNVMNLSGGYSLNLIRFELGLRNIFNVDYRYHGSGINGCGRSAVFTAILTI